MEADPAAAEEEAALSTFRDDGYAAVDWVASYFERLRDFPVLSQARPGAVRDALPAAPPERAEPFADILRDLEHVLLPAHTHWQSPRFFAYFAITGSEPGVLAELLAAALNPVAFHWHAAPASTELEQLTLSWLAQLLGLPEWHGHIEDTASTSTLAALAAARTVRPDRSVVVCSEHAHSSVDKAARILGLELRKTPVDDEFRLRVEALDLTGAVAVVATVGTTSTTSVDPVPAIADVCERDGIWLHVDAAYAGASWVCEEHRWSAAGVDRADSLVVNAHKWLLTPVDCSCLWSRRPEALRDAFTLVPEYLRTPEASDTINLSEYGPALGRRFRSLKLWAVLRCYGREGLQEVIRRHIALAAKFETWVREDERFEVVASRPFSLVCFRLRGDDGPNERLLEAVNRSGEIYVSHTRLRDRYVLRLAIGNGRTTEEDVRLAWDVIRREAATL